MFHDFVQDCTAVTEHRDHTRIPAPASLTLSLSTDHAGRYFSTGVPDNQNHAVNGRNKGLYSALRGAS